MKIILLAGGLGTRISEETKSKPKPMIEINNKPILSHVMDIYSSYGFNEFLILGGYKVEVIQEYFKNPCIQVIDTGLMTQTGGRLKQVQEIIGNETFMLTYGDGVGDINIKELLDFHKSHKKIATVTAVHPEERFGILDIEDNKVIRFREKCKSPNFINAGFFVFEPEIFDYINDDVMLEEAPLNNLSQDNQLMAYKHNGFWACMDNRKDLIMLRNLWDLGKAPWKI